MGITARDVMDTDFYTVRPETTIAEAVKTFIEASEHRHQKVFGLMVTDDQGRLVGMLSLYDMLLLMRPKNIHIWGEMSDIDVTGFIEEACRHARSILVGDVMTEDVITITPDTHLLMIVDIMIRKHVRRLPVVEGGRVIGIVYTSTIFYELMEKLAG
jgi:CBS domain-containing protein